MSSLINPNPKIYSTVDSIASLRAARKDVGDEDDGLEETDAYDSLEIFDLIRKINDPEHPLTLEQLNVTQHQLVECDDSESYVCVHFTPTIPHCSMAQLIGLCIRVKLLRCLPRRFKVDVFVTPGTHNSEDAVNRQLNDKERVAAALENAQLLKVINGCIAPRNQLV